MRFLKFSLILEEATKRQRLSQAMKTDFKGLKIKVSFFKKKKDKKKEGPWVRPRDFCNLIGSRTKDV